jgi:hypothetical protein
LPIGIEVSVDDCEKDRSTQRSIAATAKNDFVIHHRTIFIEPTTNPVANLIACQPTHGHVSETLTARPQPRY